MLGATVRPLGQILLEALRGRQGELDRQPTESGVKAGVDGVGLHEAGQENLNSVVSWCANDEHLLARFHLDLLVERLITGTRGARGSPKRSRG